MKQTLLHILLGFFIATSIAASTVAITTVRPDKPKAVIIKDFNSSIDAVEYMKIYVKKGWIVKAVSTNDSSSSSWTATIVVLEKY